MSVIDIADKTTLDIVNKHTKRCRTTGQFRSLTDYDIGEGVTILDVGNNWTFDANVKLYLRFMRPPDGGDVDDLDVRFDVDGEEYHEIINNTTHGNANDVFLYDIYDPGLSKGCLSTRILSEDEFNSACYGRGKMGFNSSVGDLKITIHSSKVIGKHWDIIYKYIIDFFII